MKQPFPLSVVHIVGARPNFMKAAPVLEALKAHPRVRQRLIHTGQHYDASLSQVFFDQLGMPKPDCNLGVGSGSHARQVADIMVRFEEAILPDKPHLLMVYGDVNSTIATALVAAKLGIRVAHVEAGLRSGDRSMPEEVNRVLTDSIADLLFVTEPSGEENLRREGVSPAKIFFVGNTMIDSLLKHREASRKTPILRQLGLVPTDGQDPAQDPAMDFGLLTLHRPSNVDSREALLPILEAVREIRKSYPVLFPCHPRTRQRIRDFGLENAFVFLEAGQTLTHRAPATYCVPPLGYLDFMHLMAKARLVLTDSGGIQEETTILGTPCLTLRNNTERPVTITHGTNILAGTTKESILAAHHKLATEARPARTPPLWDGMAAQRIAGVVSNLSAL